MDTAVWLAESKEKTNKIQSGIRQMAVAHETIEALREIDLLDDIILTKEGLVVFPKEKNEPE